MTLTKYYSHHHQQQHHQQLRLLGLTLAVLTIFCTISIQAIPIQPTNINNLNNNNDIVIDYDEILDIDFHSNDNNNNNNNNNGNGQQKLEQVVASSVPNSAPSSLPTLSDQQLADLVQQQFQEQEQGQEQESTLFKRSSTSSSSTFSPPINPPWNFMNTSAIVQSWGYPCETLNLTTSDGYHLTVFRIPYGVVNATKPRIGAVVLAHGIVSTSDTWVLNMDYQNLPFILANAGYDVYMMNVRGNRYSQGHVCLSTSDPLYWNYSVDEHALIDVPTVIDAAVQMSGFPNVSYIGHSQGTAQSFAYLSQFPTTALSKVRIFIALAPITRFRHSGLSFAKNVKNYKQIFELAFQAPDLLGPAMAPDTDVLSICNKTVSNSLCKMIDEFGRGSPSPNMNATRAGFYGLFFPGGTSAQNVAHVWQVMSNPFGKYIGRRPNVSLNLTTCEKTETHVESKHNSDFEGGVPPMLYQVGEIQVPISIYHGALDALSDPEDVKELVEALAPLQNSNRLSVRYYPTYDHTDFVEGIEAYKDVFVHILDDLKKYD